MTINLFDHVETLDAPGEAAAPWAARTPRRPQRGYDLILVPRSPRWQDDGASVLALERLEGEPWVEQIDRDGRAVRLRIADAWIERTGAAMREALAGL